MSKIYLQGYIGNVTIRAFRAVTAMQHLRLPSTKRLSDVSDAGLAAPEQK
jgi:hypothetical protein